MPRICYVEKKFGARSLGIIAEANQIIDEFAAQGFTLTLRQLFYQFVARDLLPNTQKCYKLLGNILNDGRMAGLVDWDAIEDRTRYLRSLSHWDDAPSIVGACASQFRVARWADQPTQVEVWIEKDALVGVIEGVCNKLDVPFFSCRGYVSQSEMWTASQRFIERARDEQATLVLHFGDHDPSGKDMSRDIEDRIHEFMEYDGVEDLFQLTRCALNMDQVKRYRPPPNPAKFTDSRAGRYVAEFGRSSWELDALKPQVIAALIEAHVQAVRDEAKWEASIARELEEIESLSVVASNWDRAVKAAKKAPRRKKT